MLDTDAAPRQAEASVRPHTIAPAFHTIFLLAILILWAGYSALRFTLPPSVMPRTVTYLSSIVVQSLLVGSTIAGLYHRRQFINSMLGFSAQQTLTRDIAIGIATFIGALVLVSFLTVALKFTPLHLSHRPAVLRAMAPNSLPQLLLWGVVSLAAGIGEEFVFRGYLQQQLIHWFRAAPIAIAVCSLLFGCLHFYQGTVGVLQTACLGAIYSVVALRRGNLRSVMIAHFLQDVVAGTIMFLRST